MMLACRPSGNDALDSASDTIWMEPPAFGSSLGQSHRLGGVAIMRKEPPPLPPEPTPPSFLLDTSVAPSTCQDRRKVSVGLGLMTGRSLSSVKSASLRQGARVVNGPH
jgi:hypothetical protein